MHEPFHSKNRIIWFIETFIDFLKGLKDIQKNAYIKLPSTTKKRTHIVNEENYIGDETVLEYKDKNKICKTFLVHV